MSEFLGVTLFATALVWLIALVTYNAADPVWFFKHRGPSPPCQLYRSRRRVPIGAVFPNAGPRVLPDPHDFRRRRLAPVLVPGDRREVHQARWRAPTVRLSHVVPQPRLRHAQRLGNGLPRGRVCWRPARRPARRLSQPNRIHHLHPDAAVPRDHPGDPVFLRTSVWRAVPVSREMGHTYGPARCAAGGKSASVTVTDRRSSSSTATTYCGRSLFRRLVPRPLERRCSPRLRPCLGSPTA